MPTSLSSCRVASLGCFRFSPQAFIHTGKMSPWSLSCAACSLILNPSLTPAGALPRTNYDSITFESITLCPRTTNSGELKGLGATYRSIKIYITSTVHTLIHSQQTFQQPEQLTSPSRGYENKHKEVRSHQDKESHETLR